MKKVNFKLLSLLILFSGIFFASCRRDDDPVIVTPVSISKDITVATTLKKINPAGQTDYIVTADIEILADVIIEPGVIIVFKQGTDFSIKSDDSLNATGTADKKIVFKGEQNTAGYWGGLYYHIDDLNNKLIYCSVENAGAADHTIPAKKGSVITYSSARVIIQNTSIVKSGGYGLYINTDESILDNFQSNNIKESTIAPVFATMATLKYLDGASDFTGNVKNFVEVNQDGNSVTGSHTWKKLTVPYRLPGERIDIEGAITVQAGAKFLGQQNSGFRIQPTGSFSAIGTSADSVSFRGEQNTSGYWGGFQFISNNNNNKFDFAIIADAGGTNSFVIPVRKANIEVDDTGKLTITNSTIKNSGGVGIRTISGGTLTATNVSYSNNISGNTGS